MEKKIADVIERLKVETNRPEMAFRILLSSLRVILEYSNVKTLRDLLEAGAPPHVFSPFKRLSREDIEYIESMIPKLGDLSIEESQVLVQKIIPQKKRKSLASYYTIDVGTEFMAKVASEYYRSSLRNRKKKVTIADPFLGSGRTLVGAIRLIGAENIGKVYGIEPYYLSALVAYSALIKATGGQTRVEVFNGDAFLIISDSFRRKPLARQKDLLTFIEDTEKAASTEFGADIVLTNPPFTRWSNMPKEYREELIRIISDMGYARFLTRKDPSLQILSMFLVDSILNEGGLLVAVLPASTFYTRAGEGYKRLLRREYQILALLENSDSSFSEDSGFKEVILVAVKSRRKKRRETVFDRLTRENMEGLVNAVLYGESEKKIDLNSVPGILDRNWSFFFEEGELSKTLLSVIKAGVENGSLVEYEKLYGKESLIRGIEMYGPDFFFLPNRFWDVVGEEMEGIRIRNRTTSETLFIGREYLLKVLRRPQNYSSRIVVEPDTYALSIPPGLYPEELEEDLLRYITWGESSGVAQKSIEARKKDWSDKMGMWYSHIGHQIETKKPFGNVFLPDKVDSRFANRGVFANFTQDKTAATKNFYIIRVNDTDAQRILTLWFNSTIFIALFLSTGKKISDTFIRLLEVDYLNGLVPDPGKIEKKTRDELFRIFEVMGKRELPRLREQLHLGEAFELRRRLDELMLDVIGVNEKDRVLRAVYRALNRRLR